MRPTAARVARANTSSDTTQPAVVQPATKSSVATPRKIAPRVWEKRGGAAGSVSIGPDNRGRTSRRYAWVNNPSRGPPIRVSGQHGGGDRHQWPPLQQEGEAH